MAAPLRVAHRDDLLTAVRVAIGVVLEHDPATLTAASRFRDLGGDSLALVEFADLVEADVSERTGSAVHIDDRSLAEFETLGDAADYLLARL